MWGIIKETALTVDPIRVASRNDLLWIIFALVTKVTHLFNKT